MCALNIRWGHKGSIQEFSTLPRVPGLPLARPVFSGCTENQSWVEPATFTTTTTQTSRSYGFTGRLAADKTEHDSQTGALACDLWAAATAVRLLHPEPLIYTKIPPTETRPSAKLTDCTSDSLRWDTACACLSPRHLKPFTFSTCGVLSHPRTLHLLQLPRSFISFILSILRHLSRSPSLLLIPSPTRSTFLLWAQACDTVAASPCRWGEWWFSFSLLFGHAFSKGQ